MDYAGLLTFAFAAGGAWAGVRIELRRHRRELEQIRRVIRDCPHHITRPQEIAS